MILTARRLSSVHIGSTLYVSNIVVCVIVEFQKGFARQQPSWLGLTLPSMNIESTLDVQPASKLLAHQW